MQIGIQFPDNDTVRRISAAIRPCLPLGTAPYLAELICKYSVSLKITRSRSSKLGDYRHPGKKHGHKITINEDLNPYAFLITLIHEIAHLTCWEKFGNQVKPHGIEWKKEFKQLMVPYLNPKILPQDVLEVIVPHLENPGASSCSDDELLRTLSKYDPPSQFTHLEKLPDRATFITENGNMYKKGNKLRKRYLCLNLGNKCNYYFHPLTEVILIQTEEEVK